MRGGDLKTPGKITGATKAPYLQIPRYLGTLQGCQPALPPAPAGVERESHEASGNDNFPPGRRIPTPRQTHTDTTQLRCWTWRPLFLHTLHVRSSTYHRHICDLLFFDHTIIGTKRRLTPGSTYLVPRYQNATAIISNANHPRNRPSTSACLCSGRKEP